MHSMLRMFLSKSHLALACASWLLATIAGCGGSDVADQVGAMNDSNIKRVANLYMAHQFRNGMRGPADEEAFKKFIQSGMSPRKLEMMGVDPNNVDELFISERDGQPFEVRYGLSGGPSAKLAVVFEQQGKNGKRLVGFTDGSVEEADEVRYQQLLEGKGDVASVRKDSQTPAEPAA
ncbi:MAG TPA: hypothetical protein VF175_03755 [Lacipirellula sp.]